MTQRDREALEPKLDTGLVLLLALAAAPLSRHFPLSIGAFFYAMLGLRLLLQRRGFGPPGRLILGLLAAAGLLLVLAQYHRVFGRDPGSALLLVMVGLKLLELRQRRELYTGVFLGLFLVVVQSLFDQDLLVNLYLLLVSLALIALLAEAHRAKPSFRPRPALRQLGLLLLPALPLAVVLFLLFPRLSAPLWSLYASSGSAITGFSDRLQPGSVSQLSQSEAVAFRARFSGEPPSQDKLYWRGLVFVGTDGKNWELAETEPLDADAVALVWQDEVLDYSLTLEPHRQRWLFALELPVSLPPGTRLSSAFELRSAQPVNRLTRYAMRSSPALENRTIGPLQREDALQLPDNITPRMRALVAGWQANGDAPRRLVDSALLHFRNEAFYYSLTPPQTRGNPADQFLFETRSGFCEHYATSFTLLMRIAGIPSRVVTGYQGGAFNPLGDYLIVRQSDAHAWSEVWLPERGWTRIDPTAAVAPERILRSFDPGFLVGGAPIRFSDQQLSFLRDLARSTGLVWDAVNSGWNDWVLQYGSSKQSALMQRLGLGFLRHAGMGIALVLISAAILALVALLMLGRERTRVDPVQRAFLRLCQRLSRHGLARGPSEGPRDYAERVARARPELATRMRSAAQLYVRLRYGRGGSSEDLRRLRQLVAKVRPRLGPVDRGRQSRQRRGDLTK